MHFHGPIIRPQTDADSLFIEVTAGCSHNACTFCNFYKDTPFMVAPLSQIEEDLKEAKREWPNAKSIWASGGDPFVLSTEKQIAVWDLMKKYYPDARISTYATISDFKQKSVEDIKNIKAHGLDEIMIGIETGDEKVLTYMNKGYHADEIVPQLSKMDQAGMPYEVIFLSGLGGKGYGLDHAKKTAAVFNQLHPDRILIAGLTIFPDTPLMKDVRSGEFQEATEGERILELKEFLKDLTIDTLIDATNASIITAIYGQIPARKQEMIDRLQAVYDTYGEQGLRHMRDSLGAI